MVASAFCITLRIQFLLKRGSFAILTQPSNLFYASDYALYVSWRTVFIPSLSHLCKPQVFRSLTWPLRVYLLLDVSTPVTLYFNLFLRLCISPTNKWSLLIKPSDQYIIRQDLSHYGKQPYSIFLLTSTQDHYSYYHSKHLSIPLWRRILRLLRILNTRPAASHLIQLSRISTLRIYLLQHHGKLYE